MRTAIFGLGGAAERIHLPACAEIPEIELVAGCDPASTTSARQLKTYSSAQALIDDQRPDLVIVGTPPASHFELCRLALESGAHVLCEKPFTQTVAQADELIALAEERGKLLAVNTQYRFMELYGRTRERIAAGDFGEPYAIQVW